MENKNPRQVTLIEQLGEVGYVQELFDFLQGKTHPNKIAERNKPNLSADQAWHVIYCLQEYFGLLDDKFERCHQCGLIFDSYEEGINISEFSEPQFIARVTGKNIKKTWKESEYGNYCDYCRPD